MKTRSLGLQPIFSLSSSGGMPEYVPPGPHTQQPNHQLQSQAVSLELRAMQYQFGWYLLLRHSVGLLSSDMREEEVFHIR